MTRAVFTFPSTHMAMWAEEVAGESGIPAELVPAPPGSEALCDLALETWSHQGDPLAAALDAAGVTFFRPPPPRSPSG